MNEDDFADLLSQIKRASDVVNSFASEAVQLQVTDALLGAVLGTRHQSQRGTPADDGGESPETERETTKRRRRTARRSANTATADGPTFDALSVANAVKQDPRFDVFRKKLILADASRAYRVKFVSWFAKDTPLTSGNIQKVLQALGIKMDPATASRGLSDVKDDYIKSEIGPQPTYALTARAIEEFELWLFGESKS